MDRRRFLIAAAVGPLAISAAGRAGADPSGQVVPLIGRSAWGGLRPRAGMERHRPVRLTLHHSGVRLTDNSQSPGRVQGHQRFHMLEKGHPDLDYHFVIDRRGHVFKGRSAKFRGDTQTDYDPTGHLLVCCEGDYQGANGEPQKPTKAMLRSVALVFAAAAQRWDIDSSTLNGHRDYTTMTSCPGGALERLVRNGALERAIDGLLAAGPVTWQTLPKAQGKAVVRRIRAGS